MRDETLASSLAVHVCCSNSQNYILEWDKSMDETAAPDTAVTETAVTVGGTARTLPSALIGKRNTLFCNIEELLQFAQK